MNRSLLVLSSLVLAAGAAQAQILSNGTGGGAFATGSTWTGGVAPAFNQSWTIQSGDVVTSTASLSPSGNVTHTINGALNMGVGVHYNIGAGGGATLNVNGTMTADRLFSNAIAGSAGRVVLSAGSITLTNRLALTNTITTNTAINSFTLNGGTLNVSGAAAGFSLYGADADDRAQLTINGNAGTFNATTKAVTLFNTGVGFESSATAINFNFGAAAGSGALSVVQAGALTLGGNLFTLDFTNIARPLTTTGYSTTLFTYTSFAGSFNASNLINIGLGAGESATLVQDVTNKLIRVDYTLAAAAVPEPSSFAVIAGVGALGLVVTRRRRH